MSGGRALVFAAVACASCEVVLPLPAPRACTYNYECAPIGQRLEQTENVLFLCRGPEGARRCDWGLRDEDHDGEIASGHSDDPAQRDCDDHDERRSSVRAEVLDGIDNDCDGRIDEELARPAPMARHPLFDNASGYRVETDRTNAWIAFNPDQRAVWLGEGITNAVAARTLEVPTAFATTLTGAAVIRSGASESSPLLVAISGSELTNNGPTQCATDYIGLALATQTPAVVAADWRSPTWASHRLGQCSARLGAVALARTSESATSRSLLAVWQSHDDTAPSRCSSKAIYAGAITVQNETRLTAERANAVAVNTQGTRIALRENDDGTVLIAYSLGTGLSVTRVDRNGIVHATARVDDSRVVDDVAFAGANSNVLVYSTRADCTAIEAHIVARLVDGSTSPLLLSAPQTVATNVRLAALSTTSVPRVVDAPFDRLPSAPAAATRGAAIAWVDQRPSGAVLAAARVWSGDGATVELQPLSSEPFSDELARDSTGGAALTTIVRDASVESWLPSLAGRWSSVVWQPRPAPSRVY